MGSSRYFALFDQNDVAYIQDLSGSGGGSRALTIDDLRAIDLNALVSSLHGITDPIGQLKDWLYNVLKELASWFADTVSGIVRDFWDKIMSPAISVIRTVVDSIYAFITNIPGAFADMITWIRDQFRGLWSWVQDNIAIPLVNLLNDLSRSIQSGISTLRSTLSSALDSLLRALTDAWDYIQRRIISALFDSLNAIGSLVSSLVSTVTDFLTKTLPNAVSSALKGLQDAVSGAWDYIQRRIIPSVADAFTRFAEWIQGALSSISKAVDKFFSETLPMWLSQALDMIQKTASGTWDWIQRSIISPLLDAFSRFSDWVRSGLALVSDFFTKTLPTMFSQVWDWIQRNIVSPLADAFSRFLDALRTGLGMVAEFFTKTLPGWLSQAWDWLQKSLSGAWDWIQRNIISPILDALGRFGDWIRTGLSMIIDFFTKTLPEWLERSWRWIQDAFAGAWKWIQDHIITPLWNALTTLGNWIKSGLETIYNFFTKTLPDWVSGLWKWLQDVFGDAWRWIQSNIITPLWNVLVALGDWIKSGLETVISFFTKTLPEWIGKAWGWLQNTLSNAWDFIQRNIISPLIEALSRFGEWIRSGLETVYNFFTKTLPDWIDKSWNLLQNRVSDLWRWIQERIITPFLNFIETLWKWISEMPDKIKEVSQIILELPSKVWEKLTQAGMTIWDYITKLKDAFVTGLSTVADAISSASDTIRSMGAAFMGFVNAVLRLPELLHNQFKQYIDPITNFFSSAYKILVDAGAGITDFFTKILPKAWDRLVKEIQEFTKDPKKYVAEKIIDPIVKGASEFFGAVRGVLEILWSKLVDLGNWLASAVSGAVNTLWSGLQAVAKTVSSFFIDVSNAFMQGLKETTRSIVSAFKWVLEETAKVAMIHITEPITKTITGAFEELGEWLRGLSYVIEKVGGYMKHLEKIALSGLMLGGGAAAAGLFGRFLAFSFRGFAHMLNNIINEIEVSASPLGAGVRVRFSPLRALAATVHSLADVFERSAEDFVRGFLYGSMLWYSRVMIRPFISAFRNIVPVALPPTGMLLESLRRRYPTEAWSNMVAYAVYTLSMYGYPEDFIDMLLRHSGKVLIKKPAGGFEEVVVTDRFGVPRVFPTALVFNIPSIPYMVTMMIRDIIVDPEQFKAMIGLHGVSEDIAALYYLLHFRYPSPRRLAEFYWRGIAGVLWLTETLEEEPIKKAFRIPSKAKAPAELNFNTQVLNDMMFYYMKWHDYFPAAWRDNYPTDKAIIMELMASLPDKIDVRWMTRWGLFQHLADAGLSPSASLKDIFTAFTRLTGQETRRTRVEPKIEYDVRMFARLLIANRLHPFMAPIAAVAEAHTALTASFTLLRTGFIDALRRGFLELDTAEALMSGLFVIDFKTAYIDPSTGSFNEIVYKKPIFWLPAERRILQLRSSFDRFNLLLRSAVTRLTAGVRYISFTSKEAIERFRKLHDPIATHLSAMVKALSGIDWRPAIDEGYVSVWSHLLDLEYEYGVRLWIRRYVARVMGWFLYRVAYGYVDKEKFEKGMDSLVEKGFISSREADFFKSIYDVLYGLVAKENIPTPSTLATLSEYVAIPKDLVDKVLENYKTPEEFKKIWSQYIYVKPFIDDARTAVSAYFRALRYSTYFIKVYGDRPEFKIPGEVTKDVESVMALINMSPEEKRIRELAVSLDVLIDLMRERVREIREWRPSILSLITITEYVPEAVDLISRYVIDPAFKPVIEKYARIKPLADDARRAISTYYSALRYSTYYSRIYGKIPEFQIPEDITKSIENLMSRIGITDEEKSIRDLASSIEVQIDLMREKARELREWRPSLLTLISISEYVPEATNLLSKYVIDPEFKPVVMRYASVKPLIDDARRAVSSYYRSLRYSTYYSAVYGKLPEFQIPKEIDESIKKLMESIGVTDTEKAVRELAVSLDVLVDLMRERAGELREWRPSLSMLVAVSEYVPEAVDLLSKYVIDPEFRPVVEKYASRRPFADDARAAVNAYFRLKRYAELYKYQIPQDLIDSVNKLMEAIGMTDAERSARELAAHIEYLIDYIRTEAREYVPTPSMLATISEYIALPPDLVKEALELRRVPAKWREVWVKYISARTLADDVRVLLSAYMRAKRLGVSIPGDIEGFAKEVFVQAGLSEIELRIRETAATIEALIETYPSLGQLASMAEYIDVPTDYINKVLQVRRVEKTFADLWVRYVEARTIASEVNAVASTFRTLYINFAVPDDLVKKVKDLMSLGGWTSRELQIFDFELELRRVYRTLTILIPSIRQFVTDAHYIPEWQNLLNDLLKARGIDVERYKQQIEYYKKLIRNRMVWRQIAWYRTRLMYAYAYGAIDRNTLENKLQVLKNYGLSNDEINLILDGMELEKAYRSLRRR